VNLAFLEVGDVCRLEELLSAPSRLEIDALQRTQHFVAIADNMHTLNVKVLGR
jgi:hypothetical protein